LERALKERRTEKWFSNCNAEYLSKKSLVFSTGQPEFCLANQHSIISMHIRWGGLWMAGQFSFGRDGPAASPPATAGDSQPPCQRRTALWFSPSSLDQTIHLMNTQSQCVYLASQIVLCCMVSGMAASYQFIVRGREERRARRNLDMLGICYRVGTILGKLLF
jgi:hypothetical protein